MQQQVCHTINLCSNFTERPLPKIKSWQIWALWVSVVQTAPPHPPPHPQWWNSSYVDTKSCTPLRILSTFLVHPGKHPQLNGKWKYFFLFYFVQLGLFVICHSSILLMIITLLQLFSYSIETIKMFVYENKMYIKQYLFPKRTNWGVRLFMVLAFPHKNVIVNPVHVQTQRKQLCNGISIHSVGLFFTNGCQNHSK